MYENTPHEHLRVAMFWAFMMNLLDSVSQNKARKTLFTMSPLFYAVGAGGPDLTSRDGTVCYLTSFSTISGLKSIFIMAESFLPKSLTE